MHRPTTLALASLWLIPFLPAQAAWTSLAATSPPAARTGTVAVGDGSGVLVFGGQLANGTLTDELWRFNGTMWTNLTPSGTKPSPREDYAAAWDAARGRMVLFGGLDASGTRSDTWEWDGGQWLAITTVHVPSARRGAALAYDSNLQCCVLFGGDDGAGTFNNEVWTWDSVDWCPPTPAHTPTPRGYGSFAYDPLRSEMIYFGGRDAASTLGDTWKWDNVDWTQIPTTVVPGGTGLRDYAITYDLLRERYVLFGGTNGSPSSDTWEFDGVDWQNRGNVGGVGARVNAAFAYVTSLRKSLLFGGDLGRRGTTLGDAWSYGTGQPATFAMSGVGCLGAGGFPRLGCPRLPWIGDTLTLDVRNTAATASVFITFGFQPVSIPLAAIGYPNCVVQADPLATGTATIDPVSGLPSFSLGVPSMPNLIGRSMYVQALVLDSLGVAVSARGDLVFGAR